MRIFKNAWFERFARKSGIHDEVLVNVVRRIEEGAIDADLGGGVLKQRIAVDGRGKSGGLRTIILYRHGELSVFVYGFAKNDRANIDRREMEAFKRLAAQVLVLSGGQLAELVAKGQFFEVRLR